MITGAILFGFIAMISYGLSNAFSLNLIKRLGAARFLFLRGMVVCALLAVVSIPTIGNLSNWRAVLAALAIGVFGYLPPLAFSHGIKISRISIVAPIAGTAPLITVVLSAVILSTHLSSVQWLGVVLIVLANMAVSINFRNLRDSNILKLASGVPYALIAAVLWGLVFFLIIYPTRSLGPWLSALLIEVGVTAAATLHLVLTHKKLDLPKAKNKKLFYNAALIAAGTLAYTVGVKFFNIGLVAALANSTAFVAIIAAMFAHNERLSKYEMVLAGFMIGGVVLVSIA